MKKVYNLIFNFCIPEKRCCFWVRVVMQTVQLKACKQGSRQSYIYLLSSEKPHKTPYRSG
ncbi:MAG: hypothetical protein ABI325_09645 [Ginsengibacter sp.]